MTDQFIKDAFSSTYRDDYADSDNYYRMLFNSGRALQARELTQSQTLITEQLARFGRNIFKEGASVNPGGITIGRYEFVKILTPTFDASTLIGSVDLTGQTNGVVATVIDYLPAADGDPDTLIVKYTDTNSVVPGTTPVRFLATETLIGTAPSAGSKTVYVQTTDTVPNPAVGIGTKVSNGAGDFFVEGHFVFVPNQTIILSKYGTTATESIGFRVVQDIVTELDNNALYDNQGDVPNITAPGAHRYRIQCELTKHSLIDSDEKFILFAEIKDGIIVQQSTGLTDYNKINDLLALRTKEESGDYIAKSFVISFEEDTDASKLIMDVSPGTAYVNGYRADVPYQQRLTIDKPTGTTTIANQVSPIKLGNYVIVDTQVGFPGLINTFEKLEIRDGLSGGGALIGTCRIKYIEKYGNKWKAYLFDIDLNPAANMRDAGNIGLSGQYINLELDAFGNSTLYEASTKSHLFVLPHSRPASLTDITYTVQYAFTSTASGGQVIINPPSPSSETFTNPNDWVITLLTGAVITPTINIDAGVGGAATISGISPSNANVKIFAQVFKSDPTRRIKSVTNTFVQNIVLTDSDGTEYVNLGRADVIDIVRISQTDSSGADLSGSFTLDNGQRDDRYDLGRLVLKPGTTAPSGNVHCRFNYFSHSTGGDFFDVKSYEAAVPYADIPSYKLSNNVTVSLRDVFDLRSVKGTAGDFVSTNSRVSALPQTGDIITFDGAYYNSRYDKLVISEQGEVYPVLGDSSLSPQFPVTSGKSLDLFKIKLGANTLNAEDVNIEVIEKKLYTMSDIGQLDKKIDRLQEATALSLLELSTDTLVFLDSDGLARAKSGFFVDNFTTLNLSEQFAVDYRASVDPTEGLVRPSYGENNVRLLFDSTTSQNVIQKGDNVYMEYDETILTTQNQATETSNVNPFEVVASLGSMVMSPASDEWMDRNQTQDTYVGDFLVDAQGNNIWVKNNRGVPLYKAWEWNWSGKTVSTLTKFNDNQTAGGFDYAANAVNADGVIRWGGTVYGTVSSSIGSGTPIKKKIGDKLVMVTIIPYIRSRLVGFKATGLKPNTKFYPYFDNRPVTQWCRPEGQFGRYSTNGDDRGNNLMYAAQHYHGPAELVSDGKGTITGSFLIPNSTVNDANNKRWVFRTGERTFELLNVQSPTAAVGRGASTSSATAIYSANGLLETVSLGISGTRTIVKRTAAVDPLAQTFYVPYPDGVYITSVDVYFSSKDDLDQHPVTMEIRPLVNGVPSSHEIVPGTTKTLHSADITVIPTWQTGLAQPATRFTFDEPAYLNGNSWYCFVLMTDSKKYNVYVSKAGEFLLGSTSFRSSNTSLGSMFESQNGITWTPSQEKDITFAIRIANFTSSNGLSILKNISISDYMLQNNPLSFDSGSNVVTVNHPLHGLEVGDAINLAGSFDSTATYGGIKGRSMLNKSVAATGGTDGKDWTGYTFLADSVATSSISAGGRGITAKQNFVFDACYPEIAKFVPEGTGLGIGGWFTTGHSFAGGATSYVEDWPNWKYFVPDETTFFDAPKIVANQLNENANIGGRKSLTVGVFHGRGKPRKSVYSGTAIYPVGSMIDLQRASLNLFNNIIDNQDSVATSGFNIPLDYKPETLPSGGSSASKHITVPVSLVQDAVGLNVIFSANRPSVSNIVLYYRTGIEGEILSEKSWTEIGLTGTVPLSDENDTIFRDYNYLIGGITGALNTFSQFQLKIIMNSTNSSKVPVIKDLRVTALAV